MPLGTKPVCRVCGIELYVALNWDVSRCRASGRICKECVRNLNRKYTREYRERYPGRQKEQGWKARGIDISYEEYRGKEKMQGGKCAICGKVPKNRPLAPDHNHSTGQIRDLLCVPCNGAISVLESKLTPKYKAYLEKWNLLTVIKEHDEIQDR